MYYEKRKLNIFLHSIEYLIAFGFFFIFGIIHTLALTTKTIYPNSDFTQNANNYIKLNSTGTAGITNVNLTIQGVAYGFYFSMPEDVSNNKTYTMVINFMDLDLLQSFQSSYVHISSCDSNASCVQSSIISVTKSSSTGNSNKLTIKFNAAANGSYFNVGLASDGPPYQALTGTTTFGIKNVQLESSNTSEDIINNQNQNTNSIINNNNSNTNTIIQNQDSNASAIQDTINDNFNTVIECNNLFNGTNISVNGTFSSNSAQQLGSMSFEPGTYTISLTNNLINDSYIYIGPSGTIISGFRGPNATFTVSSASTYNIWFIRTSGSYNNFSSNVKIEKGNTSSSYCVYGSSSSVNKLDQQTDAINDLNDSINDDDIGGATQDGADFILDFDTNTFGLTSIVTAPLNLIQSLTSSTCSELQLPLPFLNNKKLKLPCMTTIYQNTFGSLFTMYQTITFGIIAYWVCVRIFNQVKDFKNPEHDEIEVVDL